MAGRPQKTAEDVHDAFWEVLEAGGGRFKAVKAGNFSYRTFTKLMHPETGDKEFQEKVKRAERAGDDIVKEQAINAITSRFGDVWQAAAWWLERRYPEQYRQRQDMNHNGIQVTIKKTVVDGKTKPQIEEGEEE